MEFIRYLYNLRARHKGCVAAIGNFDGVHRGHQAIIRQLHAAGKNSGVPSCAIIFEPHPQEFFARDNAPARLLRLREKVEYLGEQGVDRVLCLRFDQTFAALSAEQFVREILAERLGVRHLVVGEDFRFGKDRSGDVSLLRRLSETYGYTLECPEVCLQDGRRVSSTWLRESLAAGDIAMATTLLGRPYTISGRVVHGDKRGRTLGFPTINVDLHRLRSPVSGIFAARVLGLDADGLPAAVSVGTRPVFGGGSVLLEAHILDFNREVYGCYVRVELLKQLRNEEMFANMAALQKQMQKDVATVREFFNNKNNSN